MVLGNWTATCKRMKLEHFQTPYIKINSKWITDINGRLATITKQEENTGRTLYDINQNKSHYDPSPRVIEIKTKVNKWDLIKLKSCKYFSIVSPVPWIHSSSTGHVQ